MNAEIYDDHYEPDYAAAHYAALYKLDPVDRKYGMVNCTDYLFHYHDELDERPPSPSADLLSVLNRAPTLGDSLLEYELVLETYERSQLHLPLGITDLPFFWATAIRELMLETHWPQYQHCSIGDVFGWGFVARYGACLHINLDVTLPSQQAHWCDVGDFIVRLHQLMEPGPYMPDYRLCEFSL